MEKRWIWENPRWKHMLRKICIKYRNFSDGGDIFSDRENIQNVVDEIVASWKIEGEHISPRILAEMLNRKNLGYGRMRQLVKFIRAFSEEHVSHPLSVDCIQEWHAILFHGYGQFRKDDVSVISHTKNGITAHFEGVPFANVNDEMYDFVRWFNWARVNAYSPAFLAIAHLWFLTIHPFEDGNGRIARAITYFSQQMAHRFSRQKNTPFSPAILQNQNEYYEQLQQVQSYHSAEHVLLKNLETWVMWHIRIAKKQ